MVVRRCSKCLGRIYSDESVLGHELSGRCYDIGESAPIFTAPKAIKEPKSKVKRKPSTVAVCPSRANYKQGCRCDGCAQAQLEYSREYSEKNKQKILEYRREWSKSNRDKIAAYKRKARLPQQEA